MHQLRDFLLRHRAIAMFVAALALCLKVAVPAGYMLGEQARVLTVVLCADASGEPMTQQIVLGAAGGATHDADKHAKGDPVCPYSALSLTALGGADVALLAAALAFILALGFAPVTAGLPARWAHLRPPLRGPPARV